MMLHSLVDPVRLFLSLSSSPEFEFRPLPNERFCHGHQIRPWQKCSFSAVAGHGRMNVSAVAKGIMGRLISMLYLNQGIRLLGHGRIPFQWWPELKNKWQTQTQKQVNKNHTPWFLTILQSDRNATGIPTLNDTLNQFESYTPPPQSDWINLLYGRLGNSHFHIGASYKKIEFFLNYDLVIVPN